MVPAGRSNLLRYDSRSRSKPYCQQYCVAAQVEVATPEAAAVPARSDRVGPSRVVARWVAMADDATPAAAAVPARSDRVSPSRVVARWVAMADDADAGKDWLQLGVATASSSPGDSDSTAPATALAASMEMDLFADKSSTRVMRPPPLFPLPIRSYHCQYGHDRYVPTPASGSTPGPFLPFPRPLRSFPGDVMMRVISPPPRTPTEAAGLWLTLQAARNKVGEPILPQIPKSYLRIKDSNMKVELVMKYLADKLGLPQSHQVELTCRGQLLPPFLLLKYVRDAIWCCSPAAREDQEAMPSGADLPPPLRQPPPPAATTDHVMTLIYSTK